MKMNNIYVKLLWHTLFFQSFSDLLFSDCELYRQTDRQEGR